MHNQFPRVAIIGDTGDGKTTTMTALALIYYNAGKKIYSNYTLKGIEWEYLDPRDIAELMFQEDSPLYDCVILTDEIHMDLGKYDFMSRDVRKLGDFATQSRKRKIIWLYTTQVFTKIVKDIRDLTTNQIYCKQVAPNLFRAEIYDRSIGGSGYIKTLKINGVAVYPYFDTEEIIQKSITNEISP